MHVVRCVDVYVYISVLMFILGASICMGILCESIQVIRTCEV